MSDFGNTGSQQGTIAPDAAQSELHPIQYDEPTAIQANPEPNVTMTEQEQADMNAISTAFDKARNAVISASQLARDVAALRETVESLRQSVEGLQRDLTASRERNAVLDEHLATARRQRDEERERAYALSAELVMAKQERDTARSELAEANTTIDRQRDSIAGLRSENDHYASLADSLEKERNALRDKLAAIEAMFRPAAQEPQAPNQGW